MQGTKGKTLALALAGAALVAIPAAATAQDKGFYIGGSFGQSKLADVCDDLNALAASVSGTISSCDDKDSAWKIFAGYRLNRNLAFEGTYIDFGELSATGASFGVPFSARADATAFGAAIVGIVPVSARFSFFGKFGLLVTEADVFSTGAGGTFSDSGSDTGLHFGVGATFDLTPAFAIRVEWEREDENEIDVTTIGAQFRF